MATVGTDYFTLKDWLSMQKPSGDGLLKVLSIVDEASELLAEAIWKRGNSVTGNRTAVRTAHPTVSWKFLNYGVEPSPHTVVSLEDSAGILAGRLEVDANIYELGGEEDSFALAVESSFYQAMVDEVGRTFFYGSTDENPEQFHGLAPRYGSTTGNTASQVITGGGTGSDNTSIWLVGWGFDTCHFFAPAGEALGFSRRFWGIETVNEIGGDPYEAYVSSFKWKVGLAVPNYRHVARICNIDVSDLHKTAETGADLVSLMMDAIAAIPRISKNSAFYMNSNTMKYFLAQTLGSTGNLANTAMVAGRPTVCFCGVPVRRVDVIADDEDLVS